MENMPIHDDGEVGRTNGTNFQPEIPKQNHFSGLSLLVLSEVLSENLELPRDRLYEKCALEGVSRSRTTNCLSKTLIRKGFLKEQGSQIVATPGGVEYVKNNIERLDAAKSKANGRKPIFPSAQYKILSFLENEANCDGWLVNIEGREKNIIPWMSREMVASEDAVTRRIFDLKDEGLIESITANGAEHRKPCDVRGSPILRIKMTLDGKEKLTYWRQHFPDKIEKMELKKSDTTADDGEIDVRLLTGERLARHFESLRRELVHMSKLLGRKFDDFMDVFHEFNEDETDLKQTIIEEMSCAIRELEDEIDGNSFEDNLEGMKLAA